MTEYFSYDIDGIRALVGGRQDLKPKSKNCIIQHLCNAFPIQIKLIYLVNIKIAT